MRQPGTARSKPQKTTPLEKAQSRPLEKANFRFQTSAPNIYSSASHDVVYICLTFDTFANHNFRYKRH